LLGALALGVYLLWPRDQRLLTALLPQDVHVVELVRFDELEHPGAVSRFDVHPEGCPALLAGDNLVLLGADGRRAPETIRLRSEHGIHDLAWMDDGSLLALSHRTLLELTGTGMKDIRTLPESFMRVRPASAGQCYLFGGCNLYLYRKGGDILEVLRAESEIGAVAGDGDFTFVAIDRSVYLMAPEQPLTLVCRAGRPIRSLALGPSSALFYATDFGVGISTGPGQCVEFLQGRGGDIRVRGETLYLFTPRQGLMSLYPVSRLVRMAEKAEDA
jgi:hypothetical protein